MRGLPWLQLVIVSVVFLALGWPIHRLLHPARSRAGAPPNPGQSEQPPAGGPVDLPLKIDVLFTSAPAEIQVRCVDQVLIDAHQPTDGVLRAPWHARLPKEGADLTLQARWPEVDQAATLAKAEGPAAIRVGVEFPDGRRVENTYWSPERRPLTELATIVPDPPSVNP